jgi:hypothetical protein
MLSNLSQSADGIWGRAGAGGGVGGGKAVRGGGEGMVGDGRSWRVVCIRVCVCVCVQVYRKCVYVCCVVCEHPCWRCSARLNPKP